MKDYEKEIENLLRMIRDKRKEMGITQKEMAEHVGTNQNSYKNIETGQASLKFDALLKILDKLKIDIFKIKDEGKENSLMTVPTSEEFVKSYFEQKSDIADLKEQNTEILALLKKLLGNS